MTKKEIMKKMDDRTFSEEDYANIPEECWATESFALRAITYDGDIFKFAPDTVKTDSQLIKKLVKKRYGQFSLIKSVLKKEISHFKFIQHISDTLKSDKTFILEIGKSEPMVLAYVNQALLEDRAFVIKYLSLKGAGTMIHLLSDEFKRDDEIVYTAVNSTASTLGHLDVEYLKNHKHLITVGLQKDPEVYKVLPDEFKGDRNFALLALKESRNYNNVPAELLEDKDFIISAIKANVKNYYYLPDSMKGDTEIAAIAFKKDSYTLTEMPKELFKSKDFILKISLADKDMLYYADEELKKDKAFALECIKRDNWYDLTHFADELLDDKEFMLEAIKIDKGAYIVCSKRLKEDSDIKKVAGK